MSKFKDMAVELEIMAERMDEIKAELERRYTPEHESLEKEFAALWRRYNALEKQYA